MDIHHIRYFLAVAETLNFTKAAASCGISQPALSRAIQQLEDEIGGLLFYRERALTQLTGLGKLMEPRLRRVMVSMLGAKSEARKFLTLDESAIRFGVMCTVGPGRLAGMLGEFRESVPGVTLRLIEGTSSQLAVGLDAGEVDAALMASPASLPDGLVSSHLYDERFLVAFPAGHRFEAMDAIPLQEVHQESYLRRLNCEYRDTLARLIKERGCALNVSYQSEKEDWIQNMVAGGLGICFIPEFSATLAGVRTRPLTDPAVTRSIALVTRGDAPLTHPLKTLVAFVKNHAEQDRQALPAPAFAQAGV